VDKGLGSACEGKVSCTEPGAFFDCGGNRCISNETVKNEGDSQKESGKQNDGFCLICTFFKMNRLVK